MNEQKSQKQEEGIKEDPGKNKEEGFYEGGEKDDQNGTSQSNG